MCIYYVYGFHLAGCSPWGHRESDTIEQPRLHTGGSVVKKNLPAIRRQGFNPWVGKIPWRKKFPSFLSWEIPWMEEPGRLQSLGFQRVGHNLATKQHACIHTHTHTHIYSIYTHLYIFVCVDAYTWRREGGDRKWDGWMASLTQWTWVWANSGR